MTRTVFDSVGRYVGFIVSDDAYDSRVNVGQWRRSWKASPLGARRLEGNWPDTPAGIIEAKAYVVRTCEENKLRLCPHRPEVQMKLL